MAALLLLAAAAQAAALEVAPRVFSPKRATVVVEVRGFKPQRVGVALVRPDGRRLGWLSPPRRRRAVSLSWGGQLRGERVADGRYRVQVVGRHKVLAEAPVRVDATAPELVGLSVASGPEPFAGDHALLATVSPNGDGLRDAAVVRFRLSEPARVTLQVFLTKQLLEEVVWSEQAQLGPGEQELVWRPDPATPPRTYLVGLVVVDRLGNRRVYGCERPVGCRMPRGPIVRVQGVDAAFAERSYAPGDTAMLRVASDARTLTVQLFHAGPESEPTLRNDEMKGVPVTDPVALDWSRGRDAARLVPVGIGEWPSGLYFAQISADDGRVGFAPFVVRPATPGGSRVAVVLPTNTWQAYNFQDADGDGWGDTWYAAQAIPSVDLARPYLNRGVPPRFRVYDLGFLRWLSQRGTQVDSYADDDLERFASGDELAALYDLVVFPGHEEYVTTHAYDVVERYRDLGGNLIFLSANNFFWRVDRRDGQILRIERWRDLGRPEARLVGVQYLANDGGSSLGGYLVLPDAPQWVFERAGVAAGGRFGTYGIEIDARTPDSPPGTTLLATIPDLLGPGRSAEMTYYETAAGAKVFAAGTLNFGGSTGLFFTPAHVLANVWARLSVP